MNKLCIFAGTTEGRRLVERLCGRGCGILVCTATEYGGVLVENLPGVQVRTGRMDAEQMAALFREEGVTLAADATHPYADQATENIRAACRETGAEYIRVQRGSLAEGTDGVFLPDAQACARYLAAGEGNILLTTGTRDLPAFAAEEALRGRLYARVLPAEASLKACRDCGIAPDRILAMQGPFTEELNAAMLRAVHARYLVTKDSGSAGGYEEKIRAARQAGAQAVIIGRPPQAEGIPFEEATLHLEERLGLAAPAKKVTLVGMGMGTPETRTMGAERALREADCLIGSRRMLDAADSAGKEILEAVRAEDIAAFIRESRHLRRFAVLLSGDTGFYSGAKKLRQALRGMDVEALPGIGSLQVFAARLGRSWEDVRTVSLHGVYCDLASEVRRNPQVFALLGGRGSLREALEQLCGAGLADARVTVGERLGYPQERLTAGTAASLLPLETDPLSVLWIENPSAERRAVSQGLPDEAFLREAGIPMTKAEVRSVILSKLALRRNSVMADVGSGTGSVTVEAALAADLGTVFAVEKKPEALALTMKNAKAHALGNVRAVPGEAPEALEQLPALTHAFIGGSMGRLREIIGALTKKNSSVRIVAAAVTLETISELAALSRTFEGCDIAQISVAKPREAGNLRLMTAQNPVWLFTMQNGGGQPQERTNGE